MGVGAQRALAVPCPSVLPHWPVATNAFRWQHSLAQWRSSSLAQASQVHSAPLIQAPAEHAGVVVVGMGPLLHLEHKQRLEVALAPHQDPDVFRAAGQARAGGTRHAHLGGFELQTKRMHKHRRSSPAASCPVQRPQQVWLQFLPLIALSP